MLEDGLTIHDAFLTAGLRSRKMKMTYVEDTDTALMKFSAHSARETREINENVYLDLDGNGNLVGMTIERAKAQANIRELLFQHVPAGSV